MCTSEGEVLLLNYKYLFTMIALAFFTLSACSESTSYKEKGEFAGYVIGATVGAVVGDDSIGAGLGAVVGAVAGTIIGGVIGEKLDEVDQMKAEIAALNALKLEDEATVRWKSDKNKNVSGTVSTKKTTLASNSDCRVVSHVVNIRGEEYREKDTLCRQSDGSWALS